VGAFALSWSAANPDRTVFVYAPESYPDREGTEEMTKIEIRDVDANGMRFRTRFAGDEGGEPVMLLHGFPETSHMWVELIPRLVEAGYQCVAPDQRGYSPGARPEGIEHYATETLAGDVIAIADAVGYTDSFHLVAHDWGAGVGWRVVQHYPERIASWTSLSIPHPASYAAGYEDPDQQERGQYIQFFQEPGVAEAAMQANDWEMLKGVWTMSPPEEVEEYLSVFTEPGAITAALNWYRAAFGGGQGISGDFTVETPTLTIWGNQDQAVGRSTTLTHNNYMTGYNRWVELDAGHWLVQEKLENVTKEVLAHLQQHPARNG
jgi:pimeloyl-ACP methyl ester carboxylesterase